MAFLPGTPAPAQEGVEALGNAVKQAGRATPRFVAIDGVAPAGGAGPALEQQRAQAIADAFVESGIDAKIIHTDLRPAADDKIYAARKDSFLIQLGYRDATPP